MHDNDECRQSYRLRILQEDLYRLLLNYEAFTGQAVVGIMVQRSEGIPAGAYTQRTLLDNVVVTVEDNTKGDT